MSSIQPRMERAFIDTAYVFESLWSERRGGSPRSAALLDPRIYRFQDDARRMPFMFDDIPDALFRKPKAVFPGFNVSGGKN